MVALHYPCCGSGHAPWTRRFCAGIRSGPTVQPFDFPEISLFPLRASGSRAAFRGNAHQWLMRSAPGTLPSISPGQLLCKLFFLCNLAHRPGQHPGIHHTYDQKAVGPPPLPGRWPSDPYMASHWPPKCSLRSVPAGRASLLEVCQTPLDVHRCTPLCDAKVEHWG